MESIEMSGKEKEDGTKFGLVRKGREELRPCSNMSVTGNYASSGEESGGDGEEWSERGGHPLLNDLILRNVLGYVRRCDLKACRGVCNKWNLRTIPHMRATFKVSIPQYHLCRRIEHFVESFNSNVLGIPFTKFKLGPLRTTDGVGQRFLELCGETATEIDLNVDRRGAEEDVYTVEDVCQLFRCCPNLKVLGFRNNFISRSGTIAKLFPDSDSIPTFPSLKKFIIGDPYALKKVKHCPSAIQELLTAAPNVSGIVVSEVVNGVSDESNISDVLNSIETLGRESSIQSLHLYSPSVQHIDQLRRMNDKPNGLKLTTLGFKPNIFGNSFDIVGIQLAKMFKDTLHHLDWGISNHLMEFPNMPHLKSLKLSLWKSSDPNPVNLTNKFPALLGLEICFRGNRPRNSSRLSFSLFNSSPSIKSLSVPGTKMTIRIFDDVLRLFPNLVELKLEVRIGEGGAEIMRQIWTHMTGIEFLSISIHIGGRRIVSDTLFSGIPTDALDGIRHVVNEFQLEGMSVEKRRDRLLELMNQHSLLPSIRNLTKLRRLDCRLESDWPGEDHPTLPTDLTAYLVFYAMNHLKHLDIIRCHFSKTCCEMLTKETGLEAWSFQNPVRKDIIPPFVLHNGENHFIN